jgi:hypothetical protein
METVQWRPEKNLLTTPTTWWPRFIARNVVNKAEMATRMAKALPNYTEEEFRTFIDLHNQLIMESLINGEQVTEENDFIYTLSFTGKLASPDDPLPPLEECLHVRVHASQPLVETVRKTVRTERLPEVKKLPLISTAQDTVLLLKDVLNPAGMLRLTGDDLQFDPVQGNGECVLAGTQSGRTTQSRFGKIENSEIILIPDIPAQANPWNNEYTVSVSTRYSEHGTLRTGTYERMLRTPLTLTNMGHPNPPETGILSSTESSPLVSVTGGDVSADETLRIQAVIDARSGQLLLNVIDMQEGSKQSTAVAIPTNGEYTLPGFSGSAVSGLTVRVDNQPALLELIKNNYTGRLVDILAIKTA